MIAFWLLAIALIGTAVFVVVAKKPVHSVVGLLAHFAVLAVFFVTLSAEFLAVIQIVVYSGAIVVLFVFVIALLSSGVAPFSEGPNRLPKIAPYAIALCLAAFAFIGIGATRGMHPNALPIDTTNPVGTAGAFGSVADFGKALFTTHLLPFEITALILMVAVIGVVILAVESGSSAGPARSAAKVHRQEREAILRGGGK